MKQQTKGKQYKDKRPFPAPYFLRVIVKFWERLWFPIAEIIAQAMETTVIKPRTANIQHHGASACRLQL